jgi:ABC-type polysaccharide/polyol phosphate export permease
VCLLRAIGVAVGQTRVLLWVITLPLVIAAQTLGLAGLGRLVCVAANVFVRDARVLGPCSLQVWSWASPVLYPAARVPEWLQPSYVWNPTVSVLDAYRTRLFSSFVADFGVHDARGSVRGWATRGLVAWSLGSPTRCDLCA